jgi:hypothetical protein
MTKLRVLSFPTPSRRQKQEFKADLQVGGGEVVLHANACPVGTSGASKPEAKQIAVQVIPKPGYSSIMCKIVVSGTLSPQRQKQAGSEVEEVSLPELLLPLSATQDVGKDTSEVITGALKLHRINADAKMLAQATTLHVRNFLTCDSCKAKFTSEFPTLIGFKV